MNGIRKEVENFNQNIDEFSQICDNELAKLYDNVEKVSKSIGKSIDSGDPGLGSNTQLYKSNM